jgi:hypothetical protein
MDDEILVFNPTATSRLKMEGPRLNRSHLRDLTLGVIDNGKQNFDVLARHMAEILRKEYGVASVVYKTKESPAEPASSVVYQKLAAQCDLVITGSGD